MSSNLTVPVRYQLKDDAENVRFAWRPLEVSNRLQDQTCTVPTVPPAPSFAPEFLTEFLRKLPQTCHPYTGQLLCRGNHLLFEAQRMIYAGAFFPEFKEAAAWRESGIDIMNREINVTGV